MQDQAVIDDRYVSGDYLDKNPTFHVEHSDFKAGNILRMMERNRLSPSTVADIGCGAGEVLKLLASRLPHISEFHGYELSPQGYALCQQRAGDRVSYFNENLLESDQTYDVVLCMDVFEHVDDYLDFLRKLALRGRSFLFHIPLDMNAQAVFRGGPLLHVRRKLGHLHYFTRDTALAALAETGYSVRDSFYTPASLRGQKRLSAKIAAAPRWLAFRLAPHLAVRTLGGYALMVLADRK